MKTRPNILYIHSHDTGQVIQPYGYPVSTPNLQKLAEEGVLFRKSFTVSPTCSPSRSALLTGMYPHNNGMTGLAHRGWSLNDYKQHLIHQLRNHGYSSTLIGTQHITGFGDEDRIGYDSAQSFLNTEDRVSTAIDFFSQAPTQPFFLSLGFYETHRDFYDPDPEIGGMLEDLRYVRPPSPVPDNENTRQDMAQYAATVRYLDQCYGRVLEVLDRTSLKDNTLVICTTDHGIAFPGMKCTLTDHGIGVLLIIRGPGGFLGGKVINAMVTNLDILPTLYDLLGLQAPSHLQGKSLLPLIHQETTQIHNEIYGEVNYHAAYEPQRSVRTERYKYIRYFGVRETPTLPNCDNSLSKQVWLDHGWADRARDQEQLFDLIFDPNETHNLVNDPDYKVVLKEMRQKLVQWMKETDDPLLNGPVPAPKGAVVNAEDAISPEEPTIPAS